MLSHPLTNFEIQKHYQNEPKFNGAYGAYIRNLDRFKSRGAHWVALYANGSNGSASYDVTYFDSFVAEHVPKEIKGFTGNKNMMTNIHRIQAYESIMNDTFILELLILC